MRIEWSGKVVWSELPGNKEGFLGAGELNRALDVMFAGHAYDNTDDRTPVNWDVMMREPYGKSFKVTVVLERIDD